MVRSILRLSRPMLTVVVAAAVLLPLAVASGCGEDGKPLSSPSADAVVATVDGVDLHASDVELVRAERRLVGEDDDAAAALDEAAERSIMRREAERLGAEADEATVDKRLEELESTFGGEAALDAGLERAGLNREQLRQSVSDGVLRESLRDVKFSEARVTPQAVAAYYRRNRRSLFTTPASVHLGAIQVRSEGIAKNALGRLDEGRPFDEVARQFSMDPQSRDNGGDLGWVLTSSLPPVLRKAVAASRPGVIAKPIGGGSMWYVLNVIAKRPANTIPLDEVRSRLTRELARVKRGKALERWLNGARERATIVQP